QNRQLKQNYNSLLVRNLPPLQTMESLLFELVWAGVILLVLAITTGALFVNDLFAQHLVHKTVFSLVSLVVFVALLIGRYTQGWRGITASRWTLAGCLLLMIGFYGSKFVLELIFHKGF
ncbi:MAG: cytochrome c biogenesis protein CcsA, partial [Marinobacter sp.]|nr:cytochrome c biogenesis protein CcsA [Marinobacter sp.]